ncbi:MAG TPA: hypothetical protein VFV99_06745 [Kofleriaceae bacterium]|nr:hypothetical protein [Kofleriaceae bacterium]
MRQYVAMLMPMVVGSGCSLLYNPSNLGKANPDASDAPMIDAEMTADADIDAPPLADANPGMLTLLDVTPKVLLEGQGQFGSRPAVLVIKGHHIVSDNLSVAITPSTGITVGATTVAMNGDYIAVEVSVAIDTNANAGMTPLTITVMQNGGPGGGVALTNKLSLQNLPQFPAGTSIATGSLAELYSDVNTGNVTFTGTARASVRSVSRIKMGNITANGGNGSTNGAGGAGPGACAGGAPASNAPCLQSDGGGVGAGGDSGGGGGGFAVAGNPGVTGDAGTGGAGGGAHGDNQIISFAAQGAGGGGGGKGALSNSGGGGGGGGTIELTAGGNIEVGTIDAKGGAGGAGSSVLSLGASGGGGGGSGGTVVLRSDTGTIVSGAIAATPGGGGASGGTGAGAGGAGAPGRVRVDVASGSLPSSNPSLHRGPAFVNVPTVVTTNKVMLSMTGANADVVNAYVIPDDGMVHLGEPMGMMFNNGMLSFQGVLLPGYNKLCVTLEPGMRGHADTLADKCIELAYLP